MSDELRQMIRQQEHELALAKAELEMLQRMSLFPQQFVAGVIAHPDRKPFPFTYTVEFKEADGDGTFATTGTAKSIASQVIDSVDHVYLRGMWFAQYRTAGTAPLGTYLPPSGFKNDGNGTLVQGLNFTWSAVSSREGRNWQKDPRHSVMVREDGYYQLPAEIELEKDETVSVEAQPLVAKGGGDAYRMFLVLDCYKMIKDE